MKLCKDCIHSVKTWSLGFSKTFPFFLVKIVTEYSSCDLFRGASLITGELDSIQRLLYCSTRRDYTCGKDAKYFEPIRKGSEE